MEGRQFFLPAGGGTDAIERSPKLHVGSSESHKIDGKNQQEVIHWHARYGPACNLLTSWTPLFSPWVQHAHIVTFENQGSRCSSFTSV